MRERLFTGFVAGVVVMCIFMLMSDCPAHGQISVWIQGPPPAGFHCAERTLIADYIDAELYMCVNGQAINVGIAALIVNAQAMTVSLPAGYTLIVPGQVGKSPYWGGAFGALLTPPAGNSWFSFDSSGNPCAYANYSTGVPCSDIFIGQHATAAVTLSGGTATITFSPAFKVAPFPVTCGQVGGADTCYADTITTSGATLHGTGTDNVWWTALANPN